MELRVSISEVMELTELPVTCVFWREKNENGTMAKHFPPKQELQFLTLKENKKKQFVAADDCKCLV
jgi:hypothetical protein